MNLSIEFKDYHLLNSVSPVFKICFSAYKQTTLPIQLFICLVLQRMYR